MTEPVSIATAAIVVLVAGLSGATTLAGVWIALRLPERPDLTGAGIGFAMGTMVMLSLVELIPEAASLGGLVSCVAGVALGVVLLGVVRLLLDRGVIGGLTRGRASAGLRSAWMVATAIVLHDVPEGFAMSSAYLASPESGLVLAAAIALHNVPEEFAMAVPAAAVTDRRLLYGAGIASALAEPLGAALGLAGASAWPASLPILLGAAAGMMLFVVIAELRPLAERLVRPRHTALGAALSVPAYIALTALIRTAAAG